jgi:hypothetical protein
MRARNPELIGRLLIVAPAVLATPVLPTKSPPANIRPSLGDGRGITCKTCLTGGRMPVWMNMLNGRRRERKKRHEDL